MGTAAGVAVQAESKVMRKREMEIRRDMGFS